MSDASTAPNGGRRIGPHGEIYVNEGTRHQTFHNEGIVRSSEWSAEGPKTITAILRQMADQIEKHNLYGFVCDPQMPYGNTPYRGPEPITTPLCHLRMWGSIEEPPRHGRPGEDYDYETYRVQVSAQLGFL